MQLLIDRQAREFVDIKVFRAEHHLPEDFGIALFESKDYAGLGSIDRAGAELNALRQAIVDAIPAQITMQKWQTFLKDLGRLFLTQLYAINTQVGLRGVEIEFAYAGFQDVCQALLYAVFHAKAMNTTPPAFERVYSDWLNNTVRVSQNKHIYVHQGQTWQVQIVNNVYGRVGLIVRAGENTYYVRENSLACPAEGFMYRVLNEVAEQLIAATNASD